MNLSNGGDIFAIKISNLCTKANIHYCSPNGNPGPLSSNINDVMIDHSNGTYTYSYTFSSIGSISIQVMLLTQGKVYQEYYNGDSVSGTSTYN